MTAAGEASRYVSVLAGRIVTFLQDFGWQTEAQRFHIKAREFAFAPIDHVFMAGLARELDEAEIRRISPEWIIIDDGSPLREMHRLQEISSRMPRHPKVATVSRFFDEVWGAAAAAMRGKIDAELRDELPLLTEALSRMAPSDLHADQLVALGEAEVPDHRLLRSSVPPLGGMIAILADAGVGKTELLKLHEWRTAVNHQLVASNRDATSIPALALRVPLRGLKSFSTDDIAQVLRHGGEDGRVPGLPKITSGAVLERLLIEGRLILLLDGLDELSILREHLERGLRSLKQVASNGGRIVIASREGHFQSVGSMASQLGTRSLGRLLPLRPDAVIELLVRCGAEQERAEDIITILPPDVVGIPLFPLMAYSVELAAPLPAEVAESATLVLLGLLEGFCERERARYGLSGEAQILVLRDLAYWLAMYGDLSASDAIEALGIDGDDLAVRLMLNPHALLTHQDGDSMAFRYSQFQYLFLAKALIDEWTEQGFQGPLASDLSRLKLDGGTADYVGRLLGKRDTTMLASAWQAASNTPALRRNPYLRRNLLAIGLAVLEDRANGEHPAARSLLLESLLGNKDLSDVHLFDLSLERIDLSGWLLQRIQGRSGYIRYCPNLRNAKYDESILGVDDLEGCDEPFGGEATESLVLAGWKRLDLALNAWVNRRVAGVPALKRQVAVASEKLDYDACIIMRRYDLMELVKGYRGASYWQLTDKGSSELGAYLRRVGSDATDYRALSTQMEGWLAEMPPFRQMLMEFAKRGSGRP